MSDKDADCHNADELRLRESQWRADVDMKLDELLSFVVKYGGWLASMIEREKQRAEFWQRMGEHCVKWGIISALTFVFYGVWLAARSALRAAL